MLRMFFCAFDRHRINHKRVWHDGLNFRTKCRDCRKPLIRDADGWRRFDEETDSDHRRLAHAELD